MANTGGPPGRSHEQQGKAGEQGRKPASNPPGKSASNEADREKTAPGTRGGQEQHGKPGHQGPKSS